MILWGEMDTLSMSADGFQEAAAPAFPKATMFAGFATGKLNIQECVASIMYYYLIVIPGAVGMILTPQPPNSDPYRAVQREPSWVVCNGASPLQSTHLALHPGCFQCRLTHSIAKCPQLFVQDWVTVHTGDGALWKADSLQHLPSAALPQVAT